MLNILVTETESYDKDCIEILKEIGKVETKKMDRKEILKNIKNFDILVIRVETRIDKQLLEKAKKLKIIGTATTGLDHIDIAYAEQKGIKIISLRGATEFLKNVNATVEHTFTLILSLIRKLPWSFDSVREEKWIRKKFFGTELNGKILGIIGFGRLGSKVAEIAKCFGMKIIAFDPYVNQEKMKKVGVSPTTLQELLKNSDIISVHANLTQKTENMISYDEFKLMKRSSMLINTSRGKIIDEGSLLHALQNKLISGAAIDVLANECLKETPLVDNPLIEYAKNSDNLIITQHLGGATFESMKKTGIYIAQKIKEFVNQNFS